ncbi:MAG: hypothetical protein HY929_00460 [Euryarchaeota archaeon]|nr:hypothetical protein [Euryarchaeota archaeon]
MKERIRLFLEIIRSAYYGGKFEYKDITFNLEPTLVSPSDFIRKISQPKTAYENLINSLDTDFKEAAHSEMYRSERGWINQGLQGYEGLKIRRIEFGKKTFLIPVLSNPAIGIDSSGIENKSTIFAFCFIADPKAGYVYLEKHLCLPRAHDPNEFKWLKLNPTFRKRVLNNFDLFLSICCEAILVVNTNVFISPVEKLDNVFIKLIDGCFSGYESWPQQRKLRSSLKEKFFSLANNIPIHCDADFSPLTADKIAKFFVRTLSKSNGRYRECTPLYATLKSHESIPIQLADIIVGAIKTKIQSKEIQPFSELYFDVRKIKGRNGKKVKSYYWIKKG